jgi:hypothetical protein
MLYNTEKEVCVSILKQALETIEKRGKQYGSAWQNAETWATLFTAATGIKVSPWHYPVNQICVKLARERGHHKRDNWIDIAGYVGVYGKMVDEVEEIDDESEEKDD